MLCNDNLKIHHIGYYVSNIEKALIEFEKLGFICISKIEVDEFRNIRVCFMENNRYIIELIEKYNKNKKSAVDVYRNNPLGEAFPYHFCYEVSDIDKAIGELKKKHYIVISQPLEAPAMDRLRVAFLFNKTIGLIEIVEIVK